MNPRQVRSDEFQDRFGFFVDGPGTFGPSLSNE